MNPPWFDARGVAVGFFIGLGIPLGAQMALLGLLRLVFRFNLGIAFAFTWVNNPFSVIPMYYGYYCLGSKLIGRPITMNAVAFRQLLKPMIHADYFWESLQSFLFLGREIVLRWSIGALVVAAACSALGYLVCYNMQRARCQRRACTMGTTYENLVKDLQEQMRERGRATG